MYIIAEIAQELEFSNGFTNLHIQAYKDILAGGSFGVYDVKKSIEIFSGIRSKNRNSTSSYGIN